MVSMLILRTGLLTWEFSVCSARKLQPALVGDGVPDATAFSKVVCNIAMAHGCERYAVMQGIKPGA